mmetsp:Transcript_7712/g.21817  ORF Transcript_7712/g.21817 Transcript_7712/m.21817 type:complete len:219 (-) Transcript_7712:460-1116(-)
MVTATRSQVKVPRVAKHLLEELGGPSTSLLRIAAREGVCMVDQAGSVVRHEEEVCLVRIVGAARTGQEPIMESNLHAPLVVLAEGCPPCKALECRMLIRVIHIDAEARSWCTLLRGPIAAWTYVCWGASMRPPIPDATPVAIVQSEGIPEAAAAVGTAKPAADRVLQDLAAETVDLGSSDWPDLAIAGSFVEEVRVESTRLAVHQAERVRCRLHASRL